MDLSRRVALAVPLGLPLAAAAAGPEHRETWRDAARGRDVPVLLRLPAGAGPAPLVLVSHGLGGSREGLGYLGRALAEAGFIALHVQHPGSDSALWRQQTDPFAAFGAALRDPLAAANRLRDVPFALDEALRRLGGQVDAARIAIAGHSFGAWTAQHALGQALPLPIPLPGIPERRLRAGVLMSPVAGIGALRVGGIAAPLLHLTGTEDRIMLDRSGPEERLAVFRAVDGVPQVLAVFRGAGHLAFAGREEAGVGHVSDAFHDRAAGLAVLFLRATLAQDAGAARLIAAGARGLLRPGDLLELKDWI